MLKYVTRGNSNPKGLPKIYFCSHSDDFDLYFDNISNELLLHQNCSIWYSDNDTDDDFFDNLRQMQLFVIPVTKKLLITENFALDVEFKFAIDNHIPVLPIMLEDELEELFNAKCGSIQFLNKLEDDETAIKYEEKLKGFLSSVLIGDELAEKIRSAFDAYIFLSYRKKDRAYAQKLMKLIHKNDFCRDIAIWYDEFLTPGENFNDAIRSALLKSDLFVLTVTPNLINELNYIETTEYPLAKDTKKPIFPVELVSTDKSAMKERYKDIPAIIDASDENLLSSELLNVIKRVAIKENDASPEHNYFIGLAYLGGIDVEVDFERAVNLITSAAESGLVIAIEKLVSMYTNGFGVAVSFEKAIYYQEKLIEIYKNEYYSDTSLDNLQTLVSTILNCGCLCKNHSESILNFKSRHMGVESGKSHEEWLEKAVQFVYMCENLISCSSYKKELMRALTLCYNELGEIFIKQKNYENAIEYYKKSLLIAEDAATEIGKPIIRLQTATINRLLGNAHYKYGKLMEAEAYYKKAIHICENILDKKTLVRALYEIAVNNYSLANIYCYSKLKNDDLFLFYHEKSLSFIERYESETGFIPFGFNSVSCYFMIAFYYLKKEDTEKAIFWFKKALDVQIRLVKQNESIKTLLTLGSIYKNIAMNSRKLDDFDEENKYLLLNLEVVKKIYSLTKDDLDASLNYASCYMSIGDNLISLKKYDEAREHYIKAIDIYNDIIPKTEHFLPKQNTAMCFQGLAKIACRDKDYEAAKAFYHNAIRLYKELIKRPEMKTNNYCELANCYLYLSNITDEKEIKIQFLQNTVSIYKKLNEIFPNYDLYKRNYMAFSTMLKKLL